MKLLALLCSFTLASAGEVTIEAEKFTKQTHDAKRPWEIKRERAGASDGAHIKALPDTRVTHDDKLIKGENFTDEPGAMAVLEYPVEVKEAGCYYVWVRTWSSGTEDNGLHFGLNGQWPESGRRWQTVQKGGWHWDCKQRTAEVHTGVPMQLWLDFDRPGQHTLMLSMREDGAEVDQIILAKDVNWRPAGFEESAPAPPATPAVSAAALVLPRQADGVGSVVVSGDLKQWHKVTLTFDGPFAHERDTQPNPFTDIRLNVTFTHESGAPRYVVPGYFAADGNAAESGAASGTKWRAHFAPDKAGRWTWEARMVQGKSVAVGLESNDVLPRTVTTVDGKHGEFTIAASDKTGRDFRGHGRLQYVGKHHLQFAASKQYFLKAGPDAPETLLAYADFDNTIAGKADKMPLKSWQPHAGDWKAGDPTWRGGKGKGLIGALNYLAGKGVNAFSFLTYNAAGDGDNVWPFVERDGKLNYDCSKLDQWGIVFDHATARGLYLHFKLQENEMDDNRLGGPKRTERELPEALDGGKLGIERRLYCREIIARYGHALALNWNIGEENTQSTEEVRDMAKFLHVTDPYKHNIVLHTFPPEQEKVYTPLLGDQSLLSGQSLQNSWNAAHQKTLHWLRASTAAGRPWVVAQDEQNPAGLGVPPDPGYKGHDGIAVEKELKGSKAEGNFKGKPYTLHDIRKLTLWGTLMAGGAGVEYYFGYALPENDLVCEDFRSRDKSWDYCRIALDFFRDEKIPFAEMANANQLVGNAKDSNDKFCFAKAGELYLVYLPNGTKGGTTDLDLTAAKGEFSVKWFNPRTGGKLMDGGVRAVTGGANAALGNPPEDADEDWLVVVRR